MKFNYNGHSLEAGIYKITNLETGCIYVGSARRFKERWSKHATALINGTHYNKHLLQSYNLHGACAFEFDILELMPGSTKLNRLEREEKHIELMLAQGIELFNKNFKPTNEPRSRKCFSRTPEETRNIISTNTKKMWAVNRDKLLAAMQTEEHRSIQSAKMKEKWSDEEYREQALQRLTAVGPQLSDLKKKQWNDPMWKKKRTHIYHGKILSPDKIAYDVYCIKEFATAYSLSEHMLAYLLKGKIKCHKGWTCPTVEYVGLDRRKKKDILS